jgi:hypothetical protein
MAKGKTFHPNHPSLTNPDFVADVLKVAKHPASWLDRARRLRHSANAVFEIEAPVADDFYEALGRYGDDPTREFDAPFPNLDGAFMLAAFAVENLLKGLILAKGLATFTGPELPTSLKTHKLLELHRLAAPNAVVPEHLLDYLSHTAIWRGRYPLPTTIDDFWPIDAGGNLRSGGFTWPGTRDQVQKYCDELEAELKAVMPPRPRP